MKQFLSACLAVLLLAVLLVLPAAAEETADAPNLTPEFSVTAEAAYVANTDTGLVVYEKNSETPMAAACCMPCCCPAPTRQRISWQTI